MTDWWGVWALAFAAGLGLAAVYAGLLWVGVRGIAERHGATRFAVFAALRAALVLGALALAVWLGLEAGPILAGLAGFVAFRIAVTRRVGEGERQEKEDPSWK